MSRNAMITIVGIFAVTSLAVFTGAPAGIFWATGFVSWLIIIND